MLRKSEQYFHTSIPETSLILKYKNAGLYGKSPGLLNYCMLLKQQPSAMFGFYLIGKTGTGKELIAKAIHKFSSRTDFPFIAIDCGAIPNTLLESEFFGHKRGAFTGAQSDRQGLFLEAMGEHYLWMK